MAKIERNHAEKCEKNAALLRLRIEKDMKNEMKQRRWWVARMMTLPCNNTKLLQKNIEFNQQSAIL